MDSDSEFEGRLLGRYRLESEISKGGMGRVYLAKLEGAHGFQKSVAVKVIHPHLAMDRHILSMFLDEARVASLINHVNVCAVQDFGAEDGVPYLVMEHLDGAELSEVLHLSGVFAPPLAARVVADAARGLHAAHELRGEDGKLLNVVHRDVSPQNVFLLHQGAVKVLDFGIARMKGRLAQTQATELKGKIGYMAPEQLTRGTVDRRADIWALGVILWEATVGRRLVVGENFLHKVDRVLEAEIPCPHEFDPSYPLQLEEIVMSALERDIDRRTSSAAVLADDLESYLYGTGRPCGAAQVAAFMNRVFAATGRTPAKQEPSGSAVSALASGFGSTMSIDAEEADPDPGRTRPDTDESGGINQDLVHTLATDTGEVSPDLAHTLPADTGEIDADLAHTLPADTGEIDADLAHTLPAETSEINPDLAQTLPAEAGEVASELGRTLPVEGEPHGFAGGRDEDEETDPRITGHRPQAQRVEPVPNEPFSVGGASPVARPIASSSSTNVMGPVTVLRDEPGFEHVAEASQPTSPDDDRDAHVPSRWLKITAVVSVGLAVIACSTVAVLFLVRGPNEDPPIDFSLAGRTPDAQLTAAGEGDADPLTPTVSELRPGDSQTNEPSTSPLPVESGSGDGGVGSPVSPEAGVPAHLVKRRRHVKRNPVRPIPSPRTPPETGYGTLNLLVIPPSDVYFQGRRIGRTPLVKQRLPAGRHVLSIRPTDGRAPRSVPVVILAGKNTRRTIRLR